ncbi:MAG TPA: hypothetical protein VE623_19060 [Acidimicrobiales bacterium]|nr:hypothetical protein [Acidimicrobiales bacterium]
MGVEVAAVVDVVTAGIRMSTDWRAQGRDDRGDHQNRHENSPETKTLLHRLSPSLPLRAT